MKNAILLNNNPLMVKRFLKGTKQLSDLLLVTENANSIVNKMEKILTIFYDSGNVQGSMRDVLQHLLVKKNLNVKAMEGDFEYSNFIPLKHNSSVSFSSVRKSQSRYAHNNELSIFFCRIE